MRIRVVWAAAGVLALGFGQLSGQASLVVRDSIVLSQSTDTYLTVPTAVVPDGSGYLVTDAQQPHVFRFLADGSFDRTYGRAGQGPGEFKELAVAMPFSDEDIIAISWSPPAAQVFKRRSGEFLRRVSLEGPIETVVLESDQLWISGHRATSSLRRQTLDDAESVDVAAPAPWYRSGAPLGGIFPKVPFTKWADTLLVGYEPMSEFVLVTSSGQEQDRFTLPSARRRGTPPDPNAAVLEALRRGPYHEVFGVLSTTQAIRRRSDGTILIVHFDSRAEPPPVPSEAFVTVLSADRSEACLDARIPLGEAAQPAVGFEGDDLLVLEQVVDGFDVAAVLRRVEVHTEGCEWIPTQR